MPTLAIGSTFAGYVIDAIVARGGMGVVYRATQSQPQRRVALKLIAPEFATEAAYRERFLREADLLASLDDCPSIVPIYAAGESDGQLYLAMRFLDGPDLAALIKQDGPLPLARTAAILEPVAAALDAAHHAGLVHRDVKPSNIMLDRRSAVYLMDFGLTKRAASESGLTRPGQAIGTAGYMAPEQFTGRSADPALAPRIDIYALGCVLHACLTGEEPYPRDSYEQALFAHVYDPPPKVSRRRSDIPAAIDDILAQALAKDPRDRFEQASDLARAVRDLALSEATARAAEAVPAIVVTGPPEATVAASITPELPVTPETLGVGAIPPPPGRRRIPPPTVSVAGPATPVQPPTVVVEPVGQATRLVNDDGPGLPGRGVPASPLTAGRSGRNPLAIGAIALILVMTALSFLLSRGPGDTASGPGSSSEVPGLTAAPAVPTANELPSADITAAPTPSVVTSAAPSNGVDEGSPEDVADLIASLPAAVASTCESTTMYATSAIADVMCRRPDGGLVWYTRFADAASMVEWYDSSVRISTLAPDTIPCGDGAECETGWQFQTDETVDLGRIVCYVNDNGDALINFTVDANLTMGSLFDSDGDLKSLYDAWAVGDLIPPPS